MQGDAAGSFFVGREREIRRVDLGVRYAHAGRGRPLLIVGEPGIGKTRTIEEVVRRCGLAEDAVLWARAPEQEGAPAYWPWLQILRRHLEAGDDDRARAVFAPDAPVLAQLLPRLRDRLPDVPAAPRRDGEQSRFLLFEAVVATLRRAAVREPLLVVLEDLHWADDSSLQLLLFAASEMTGGRFAIVATSRPAAAWRAPEPFGDLARCSEVVELGGLEREDVARFVAACGGDGAPAALIGELRDATGGNPFFLGEVVQHLRRQGRLADAHLDPASLRPSDGVRAFIRRHLEPLPEASTRCLTVASVLGRQFDAAALAAVGGTEVADALAALATPLRLHLVEAAEGQACFRFAHALIRETLYGDLSPAERADLHRSAARSLEARAGDGADAPVAEIAHHYLHAAPLGCADRAAAFAARAGERAVAQLAFEDGVVHFERALAALALVGSNESERLRLQLALGSAALRAGDQVRARASFVAALHLARALGDAAGFARAAYGLGGTRVEANSADPALIAALEEALAMADPAPSAPRASLLARLASALYFTGEVERRDRLSREAVDLARAVGEPTTLAAALITRHFMLWGSPDPAARLALVDEAIDLATAARHTGLVLEARTWRLVDLLQLGEVPAMEIELERYARDAGTMRFPKHRRYSLSLRASLAQLAGHFAEAERLTTEARAIPERRQDTSVDQVYLSQLFQVRREIGGLAEVAAEIEELARALTAAPSWRCGVVLIELDLGRVERARAMFEEIAAERFAVLPRDGNLPHSLCYCAEAAARLGEASAAAAVHELLLPFDGLAVAIGSPPFGSLGAAARYLGLTAAAVGRREAAIAHLDAALALNEKLGALPQLAHTRADLARILAAGSAAERERASDLLGRAREIAAALGMRVLLARLDADGAAAVGDGAAGNRGGAAADVAGATGEAAAAPPGAEATCRREGDFWTVAHAGHTARLRDAKGFALLAVLLRHPGREFHVLELETASLAPAAAASAVPAATAAAAGLATSRGGDAGEVLDAEARAAYRRRLRALQEELRQAGGAGDAAGRARIEREIEFLSGELSRGVGLGGRSRKAASASERSRLNVTRALGRVVRRIAEVNPALGRHLDRAVKTGTYCSYEPDQDAALRWDL